eukprot:1142874-Pelagomonas_calceolata.AAC.1
MIFYPFKGRCHEAINGSGALVGLGATVQYTWRDDPGIQPHFTMKVCRKCGFCSLHSYACNLDYKHESSPRPQHSHAWRLAKKVGSTLHCCQLEQAYVFRVQKTDRRRLTACPSPLASSLTFFLAAYKGNRKGIDSGLWGSVRKRHFHCKNLSQQQQLTKAFTAFRVTLSSLSATSSPRETAPTNADRSVFKDQNDNGTNSGQAGCGWRCRKDCRCEGGLG